MFAVLARIQSGDNVFRPLEATEQGHEAFQQVAQQLMDLRSVGWLRFPDGRIMRSSTGGYLLVGPCDLTPAGVAALARDRGLGPPPAEEG